MCTRGLHNVFEGERKAPSLLRRSLARTGELANAQAEIVKALQLDRREPLAALGEYLTAAETAAPTRAQPARRPARDDYNFAVAASSARSATAKLDPWTQPLRVPASGGDFVLTHKPDPRPQWNPALYNFTPADQFDIHGTYVTERTTRRRPRRADRRGRTRDERGCPGQLLHAAHLLRRHRHRALRGPPLRALLRGSARGGNRPVDGHTFPLAADFTVPLAVMLASTNPKKLELSRLLHPEKYAETARISRLQPYDPNKTVVLVIHGLMDSPATWTPMLNRLRGDAEIRRNYQFWFYSYPSGYPYPYSAAILRRELDAIEKRFPLRKPMVVIGHSMGGCISRLLITDTGEKLWLKLFDKPPEQVPLSPKAGRSLPTRSSSGTARKSGA